MFTKLSLIVCFLWFLPAHSVTKNFHLSDGWYPGNSDELQQLIVELTDKSRRLYAAHVHPDSIKAIIVPHAGYQYSGTVAASVYSLVNSAIERVIIIAPDHSGTVSGVAIPNFDQYHIPTGNLIVDAKVVGSLSSKKYFSKQEVFNKEHSLEVQLPFVTHFFNKASIVPLLVGNINCKQAKAIARALREHINAKTLVIISTDFVHYGERFGFTPFKDAIDVRIRDLNSQAITLIEKGQCQPFTDFIAKSKATICGANPLKIFLSLNELQAFGTIEPRLIAYDTSGKNEKDSVSYVGMLFTTQKLADLPIEYQLTNQEQRNLYQYSRMILDNLFKNWDQELHHPILSFGLTRKHGAFVTLRKKSGNKESLRGCIGRIFPDKELWLIVKDVTIDSALYDDRFKPVTQDELSSINLMVSVLSGLRPLDDYKKIRLGKDGVVLKYKNVLTALFLPEVAIEQNWDIPTMLDELAQKARFPKNAWRDKDAAFEIFTTLDIHG